MLTDARAQIILDVISEMTVELPMDIEELGPSYLQSKILEVNRHNSNANFHYREVLQARMEAERALGDAQSAYEIQYDETIISDKVLIYPSAKDRESKTKSLLRSQIQEIAQMKREITGIKHIETILKAKLAELKTISQDIQKLRSLMRDGLDTHSYRGSEDMHGEQTIQRDPEELLQGVSLVKSFKDNFEDVFTVVSTEDSPVPPPKVQDDSEMSLTSNVDVSYSDFLSNLS